MLFFKNRLRKHLCLAYKDMFHAYSNTKTRGTHEYTIPYHKDSPRRGTDVHNEIGEIKIRVSI